MIWIITEIKILTSTYICWIYRLLKPKNNYHWNDILFLKLVYSRIPWISIQVYIITTIAINGILSIVISINSYHSKAINSSYHPNILKANYFHTHFQILKTLVWQLYIKVVLSHQYFSFSVGKEFKYHL